ncbi:MAG: aminoacyl-tRNA hydrolase [bacterium]
MSTVRLIVGLGNPGASYQATRHNIGEWWVRDLARRFAVSLTPESKFKGDIGRGDILGHDVRLLVPTTYMNLSGESVGAVQRFFKIPVESILVVYDEMAFVPGVVRLKQGGGDNGHNGIKSIRAGLGNNAGFMRMRIGVGHPGSPSKVTAFLTQHVMPPDERLEVERCTTLDDELLSNILQGNWQQAMNVLHATGES